MSEEFLCKGAFLSYTLCKDLGIYRQSIQSYLMSCIYVIKEDVLVKVEMLLNGNRFKCTTMFFF